MINRPRILVLLAVVAAGCCRPPRKAHWDYRRCASGRRFILMRAASPLLCRAARAALRGRIGAEHLCNSLPPAPLSLREWLRRLRRPRDRQRRIVRERRWSSKSRCAARKRQAARDRRRRRGHHPRAGPHEHPAVPQGARDESSSIRIRSLEEIAGRERRAGGPPFAFYGRWPSCRLAT